VGPTKPGMRLRVLRRLYYLISHVPFGPCDTLSLVAPVLHVRYSLAFTTLVGGGGSGVSSGLGGAEPGRSYRHDDIMESTDFVVCFVVRTSVFSPFLGMSNNNKNFY
jgi:hypothetical protein